MNKEKREDILLILLFPFWALILLIGVIYSAVGKLEEILNNYQKEQD